MDEKTATYVQCASIGLGCALSVLGFAYACWSQLTPNLLKLFVQD